jgi:hypothetical protein
MPICPPPRKPPRFRFPLFKLSPAALIPFANNVPRASGGTAPKPKQPVPVVQPPGVANTTSVLFQLKMPPAFRLPTFYAFARTTTYSSIMAVFKSTMISLSSASLGS